MFDHNNFEHYAFEDVPLDRDIYLVDEEFAAPYEAMMLALFDGGEWAPVGYMSSVAANKVTSDTIELSWYANVHDRFHEIPISLPRASFRYCVGCRTCDETPRIFVDSEWLRDIHLRSHSIFGLIDVIGVTNALQRGQLSRSQLVVLRDRIDAFAETNLDIAFVTFADSLLLKTNWSVGHFQTPVRYSYTPERLVGLFGELRELYRESVGLSIYGVFTQGSNEYYRDPTLHISSARNHVCLNSLGLPFAQLQAIEHSARDAIRQRVHQPAELYLDDLFFYSLRFKDVLSRPSTQRHPYVSRFSQSGTYFYGSYAYFREHLDVGD